MKRLAPSILLLAIAVGSIASAADTVVRAHGDQLVITAPGHIETGCQELKVISMDRKTTMSLRAVRGEVVATNGALTLKAAEINVGLAAVIAVRPPATQP